MALEWRPLGVNSDDFSLQVTSVMKVQFLLLLLIAFHEPVSATKTPWAYYVLAAHLLDFLSRSCNSKINVPELDTWTWSSRTAFQRCQTILRYVAAHLGYADIADLEA